MEVYIRCVPGQGGIKVEEFATNIFTFEAMLAYIGFILSLITD